LLSKRYFSQANAISFAGYAYKALFAPTQVISHSLVSFILSYFSLTIMQVACRSSGLSRNPFYILGNFPPSGKCLATFAFLRATSTRFSYPKVNCLKHWTYIVANINEGYMYIPEISVLTYITFRIFVSNIEDYIYIYIYIYIYLSLKE